MFAGIAVPVTREALDEPKPLSASKTPLTTGKGYECWSRASVPNLPWLKSVTDYQSLAEIHLS